MNKPHWYLPLSDQLGATLAAGTAADLRSLCHYQTAALVYLLLLPKAPARAPLMMEQAFAQLLENDIVRLKDTLSTRFTARALRAGLDQAGALRIGLMEPEVIARRPFIRPGGQWDFDYAKRYQDSLCAIRFKHERNGVVVRLSNHQLRLIRNIGANREDSIEVQAHAGTGKTFVLEEVLAMLPARNCLFLADVTPKLEAVRKRFGGQVQTATFKQMAEYLLARGDALGKARLVAASRLPVDYQALAEQAGLGPIGHRNAAQVASLCWKIIGGFCASADTQISHAHLPADQLRWLTPVQQQQATLAAQQLWWKMSRLESEAPLLPVRGYHRIKQMILAGLQLSERIKTIIIDEGHDLSGAMVGFLDQAPQTVITLGDPFQNLDGRHVPHNTAIRYREMAISLRCGPALVDHVNALIELFPEANALPFVADNSKQMVVTTYPAGDFPPEPAVILVADEWGLFDWLIRSREANKGAAVIDWDRSCEAFLEGCLDLYLHGKPARHGALSRYQSWAQLRQAMAWNDAFCRVEYWLERVATRYGVSGLYRRAELQEFAGATPQRPLLATVFTAKNFELPNMALSEDLYYFAHLKGKQALSRKLALLYTALTRACGKIHLPDTHQERLAVILDASRDAYRH